MSDATKAVAPTEEQVAACFHQTVGLFAKHGRHPVTDRDLMETVAMTLATLLAEVAALSSERDGLRGRVGELERALDVRPEVRRFAALMEAKLRRNDHKGGWTDGDENWLLDRLREETDELADAIRAHRPNTGASAIGKEAADVANFAMMLAGVFGALATPEPTEPK